MTTQQESTADRVRALVGDEAADDVIAAMAEERTAALTALLDAYEVTLIKSGKTKAQAEERALDDAILLGLVVGLVQQSCAQLVLGVGERVSAAAGRADATTDAILRALESTGEHVIVNATHIVAVRARKQP